MPWKKLTYDTDLGGFVTDITQEQLSGAPTWGDNWYDDRAYRQRWEIGDHRLLLVQRDLPHLVCDAGFRANVAAGEPGDRLVRLLHPVAV